MLGSGDRSCEAMNWDAWLAYVFCGVVRLPLDPGLHSWAGRVLLDLLSVVDLTTSFFRYRSHAFVVASRYVFSLLTHDMGRSKLLSCTVFN